MKTADDKKPENSLMRLADRPEDYQRYGIQSRVFSRLHWDETLTRPGSRST